MLSNGITVHPLSLAPWPRCGVAAACAGAAASQLGRITLGSAEGDARNRSWVSQGRMVRLLIAASAMLYATLSGCAGSPFALPFGTFRGHYSFGFESNDFIPCGAPFSERWWVAGDVTRVYEMVGDLGPDARVYVRWHGDLSGKGSYGDEGLERQIRVTRVLEVQRLAGGAYC